MNICFVSICQFDEYTGGIDRVSCILAREFLQAGHKVFSCYSKIGNRKLHCGLSEFQLPSREVLSDINITYLHNFINEYDIDILIECSISMLYRKLINKAKIDTNAKMVSVLHCDPQSPTKGLIDSNDERIFKCNSTIRKWVTRIYLSVRYPIAYYLRNKTNIVNQNKICALCDAYVLLSKGFADFVKNNVKQPEKVFYISNPIEYDANTLLQSNHLQTIRQKQVVFCGRIEFQKRTDRMLRIWQKVEKHVDDWTLIIIGDGHYRSAMEAYSHQLGLTRCKFVGNQASIPFMEKASIVCVTSTHEGFSMVLLEGQQKGCVPVAFDSYYTVRDIIDDKQNGILIKPFCEKQYAENLISLIKNIEYRYTIAQNALLNPQRFTASKIARQWIQLFNELK